MNAPLLPQTFFLEDAVALARQSLLARLDPSLDYQPYFRLDLSGKRPQVRHARWDYCDMAGRFVDALILTAPMIGLANPTDQEEGLRAFLLRRANRRDGLFYNGEAPWSTYQADMFCQGRVLLGLVSWFLLTGEATVQDRIEALIAGLSRVAVWDGDICWYPNDIWITDRWVAGGLWNGRAPGYWAQQTVGLARYAAATGSTSALRLATGLSRFFVYRSGVVGADGSFHGHTHSQGILPRILGALRTALILGDPEIAAWATRAYEHARRHTSAFGWIPDGLGLDSATTPYAGTCETCALSDLIELAITLTEAGFGDYWDDIERFARNQLLEQQIRDVQRLFADRSEQPVDETVKSVAYGAFDSAARPNALLGDPHGVIEGCCTPAGARACFLVWDRTMTRRPGGIVVNLTFSRDAPWARLISFEPYRGELRLEVREPAMFFLRLPSWVERSGVRLTTGGTERPVSWHGQYLTLGMAQPGQSFGVTYPQRQAEFTDVLAGQAYVTRWKGNTVIQITPPGEHYPIYERTAYLATEPPLSGRAVTAAPVAVTW